MNLSTRTAQVLIHQAERKSTHLSHSNIWRGDEVLLAAIQWIRFQSASGECLSPDGIYLDVKVLDALARPSTRSEGDCRCWSLTRVP